MPGKVWTESECAVLRKHYPTGGPKACLELLSGRSQRTIYQKARDLDLYAPNGGPYNPVYTSSEWIDAQIRRYYQQPPVRNGVKRLAQSLGRPRWWVSKRAIDMGLVAVRPSSDKTWSEAEILIVERNQGKVDSTISRILSRHGFKRTATAVNAKRKRIMISARRPGCYSANELAQLMGVDGKTVTRWIKRGLIDANRQGTNRVKDQGGDHWVIRDKAIRSFLMQYTHHVDLRKIEPNKAWFVDLLTGNSGAKGRIAA